jgi:hypothetical protein
MSTLRPYAYTILFREDGIAAQARPHSREIARMLSGATITAEARAAADSLLAAGALG